MFSALELKAGAALLAVAALSAGLALYNAHQQSIGKAEAVALQAQQTAKAAQASQVESDRRATAQQEIAQNAQAQADAARTDADTARTASDRLRIRLAAAERRAAAKDPATASTAPATDTPSTVPYDVFARIDDAAGQLGAYADQLRVNLSLCIGSYNALTPQP